MLKQIKRHELEPGMFLAKYGRGTADSPFVAVERPVLSFESVQAFLPDGVEDVVIEDSLTISIINEQHKLKKAAQATPRAPLTPLAEELPVAEKLYNEAFAHAHSFMDEARRGQAIDCREAMPIVDGFIRSIYRNEAAAAMLFNLKKVDEYTYTHGINVGVLAIILGKYLELDAATLKLLGVAGLFHDVGKARIPEEILNKPASLNLRETRIIRTHPLESYRLVEAQSGLDPNIARGVIEHHERYDGSGYPRGLTGGAIGMFGRVLSIVDVYDALTSKRAYKKAMPASRALGMMYQWRDTTFSPTGIEHFIKCIGVYPIGSFVRLSSGEYAITTSNNEANAARPRVKIVFDAAMRPRPPAEVDLSDAGASRGLEIAECLDPTDYRMDLSRVLNG